VLHYHLNDPEVQREACGLLRALAAKHPAGARRVIDSSGIMLCLQAIMACPDEAVGDAACGAIAEMQCAASLQKPRSDGEAPVEFEAKSDANVRAAWEAGLRYCAEQCRVAASDGSRLTLQALLAAANVLLEESSVRSSGVGIVEPVVRTMHRFQGHAKIQVPACGIISRMTVGHQERDEAVSKVAVNGGIGAVCQAMRDLPLHEELHLLAIAAIRNVAFANDANKTAAVRAGGIPATVTAMLRFRKEAKLQEQAIGALTSICDTVGRAMVCARLGGVEAIIAALKRHPTGGHVAELGCIMLCMFCDDAQLRQHIVRAHALPVAKSLSRSEQSEVRRWGCELLRHLSESGQAG